MKPIKQFMIIISISFLGELLHSMLPLPVPASIYGLLLLFLLLMTGFLKLEQIEEVAEFFLAIMPLLFLSPSVSLITVMDQVMGAFVPIVGTIVLSTIVTTVITGLVTQWVMKLSSKRQRTCGKGEDVN
ncbi:MAG: CidA/LrgA family protein [Roseburia sp.]|nr:CidA/LrgA family protein [Roseburia sp.]MCM1277500.1 CidA/LrgA family protein [Robinsoniella sp.]